MSHVQHDVYTTFENECVFVSVRVWNKGLNGLRFVCFFMTDRSFHYAVK